MVEIMKIRKRVRIAKDIDNEMTTEGIEEILKSQNTPKQNTQEKKENKRNNKEK